MSSLQNIINLTLYGPQSTLKKYLRLDEILGFLTFMLKSWWEFDLTDNFHLSDLSLTGFKLSLTTLHADVQANTFLSQCLCCKTECVHHRQHILDMYTVSRYVFTKGVALNQSVALVHKAIFSCSQTVSIWLSLLTKLFPMANTLHGISLPYMQFIVVMLFASQLLLFQHNGY